jgi:diguanylate cyclase (GGDEF)-like protein
MGDVNGLKLTNDTYGHTEGDKLLIAVADILRKCCRKEEIIARIGGDEFCIIMPQTDSATAQSICSRIYQACDNYKSGKGKKTFYPSISLGHSTKDNSDQSIDQVIKDAEDYMYHKKLLERNTTHSSVINSIQATMRESSNDTEEHSDRMIKMSIELGSALGLSDEQLLELDLLSRLHDIGKICIDERILSKPGKLTEAEWAKVKQHPEVGYKIAQASTELVRISQLILSHHERWDGNGYPQGLNGVQIPLLSRIIAIIDAYDAMTQDRPYRKAMPKESAINEIIDNANKQFDPQIAQVFIEKVLHEPWERH